MLGALLVLGFVCLALGGVTIPEDNKPADDLLKVAVHLDQKEHDSQYDHDSFLGQDDSKVFDHLPPEESKRRLGIIVDRIDQDANGFISTVELKDWIRLTQKRYIEDDVARNWMQHNPGSEDSIPWETYRKNVYGFMEQMSENELENPLGEGSAYSSYLKRDRRRWHHADEDEDDHLNRTEFSAFLHPEENPLMKDIIILETLEDMDKDKDGKINIDEFIGDMHIVNDNEEEEPDWIKHEKEQFSKLRDMNGDGFMDAEEMREWIAPPGFDHAEAEARHLVFEADANNDERLSKEEVLDKYDLFVGSQATDFGQALSRHDEF